MAPETNLLESVDVYLSDMLSGWDVYTTALATTLGVLVAYPLLTWKDPDTHPMLLARQATASPVRHPEESSVYRSLEAPHGYPLRSGLNVKDPEAPKWSSGRDGDLRDVWRQAVRGALKDDGTPSGVTGKILTILGREQVLEHKLDDVTIEINGIGKYIQSVKGQRVAICLSNSVETLAGIFAAAFYDFQAILVPHGLSSELLAAHLKEVDADVLIAEAGAVELPSIVESCPGLAHVIWVTKHGNRHMDWNEVPEGFGGKIEVSTWHDLIEENKASISSEVPSSEKSSITKPLMTFWPSKKSKVGEIIELTSANMVSAIAALMSCLPRNQRMTNDDLFLPIDSLCFSYPLMLTFGALFSNASVALNSVAGENADFVLATCNISPTIIVASEQTVSDYHDKLVGPQNGAIARLGRWSQSRTLAAGNMPQSSSLIAMAKIGSGDESGKRLRLIYVSHRIGASISRPLALEELSNIRIFTGVRIVYALTSERVAGAVSQTNLYDYRDHQRFTHFGPPLSSLEVKLINAKGDDGPDMVGDLFVEGHAVVGGQAALGVKGRFGEDHTLSLY